MFIIYCLFSIAVSSSNPFQDMTTPSLGLPIVEYANVGPGFRIPLKNDLSSSDEELDDKAASNFSWDGHQIKEEYDTFTSSTSNNLFKNY